MLLDLDNKIKSINKRDDIKKLGDRMKEYENLTRFKFSKEYPMIIRIDGNAFHTFTKGFVKPFDSILKQAMEKTSIYLLENIPGSQMSYHQSDEISILVTNYKLSNTEPWFDNNISKITSITASMATLYFNKIFSEIVEETLSGCEYDQVKNYMHNVTAWRKSIQKGALFDSRVFIIPKEEVTNYFIWRQQDAIKNAISMVAHSLFSHKSLQNLNSIQKTERMFYEKSINYENSYSISERRGSVGHRLKPLKETKTIVDKYGNIKIVEFERSRWGTDLNIPVFREDRGYIEKFL